MDDVAAGERRRKGDALPPPASASFPALTPRGLGLLLSPSGSSLPPSPPPPAATTILALPAFRASAAESTPLLAGAMDGEALLVRRSKPKKGPSSHAEGRESGGGESRFLALWRDYHDLLQEMEAKKRRLDRVKQRKLRLLAEVKFLRRKYKFLVKCNSQQPQHKLKGQAAHIQAPVGVGEASAFVDHGTGTGVSSTSKNTNLDLNQDSVMNDERFDLSGYQGAPKRGKFDQDGADEDTTIADVKFSVCSRGTGNSPSSDDKRTISWQDRFALPA